MNVVKEIQTMRNQLDFIVDHIQKGENMLDPNIFTAELAKATALLEKSKSVISSLHATIKTHEATIEAHLKEFNVAKDVESAVSTIASKFSSTFAEFEDFLNGVNTTANTVTNAVKSATPVIEDVAQVAAPIVEAVVTVEAPALAPVVSAITNVVTHDIHNDATKIGPLQANT